MLLRSIFTLSLVLISFAVAAKEIVLRQERFVRTDFADPRLKKFEVRIQYKENTYSFANGIPYYLAKMVAGFQTRTPEQLSRFGVVQFIRGCHFSSYQSEDGKIEYSINSFRDFFGGRVEFRHPQWVVDSVDVDPVYWSSQDPAQGRIGLYRLDDPMLNTPYNLRKILSQDLKGHKEAFVRDMPTGAGQYDQHFLNTSLEFKTCLYDLKDVPLQTDPSGKE